MIAADPLYRFSVRWRALPGHHAALIEAASFEDAAVIYLERAEMVADDHMVSVCDLATGREHCLRIDLDTAETTLCD